MAAELLTDASRATDANSNPYAGAQWRFYASGTLTPQNVYADADLSTSLGAVVTADAGGKFVPIYFDSNLKYRGILKSSDDATTIYDIDPINTGVMSQLSEGGGAELVGYQRAGVDTVTRTLASRADELPSLFDWEGSGSDDTVRLERALAGIGANTLLIPRRDTAYAINGILDLSTEGMTILLQAGATLDLDVGKYDIDFDQTDFGNALRITENNVSIIGQGPSSVLRLVNGTDGNAVGWLKAVKGYIGNLTIDGGKADTEAIVDDSFQSGISFINYTPDQTTRSEIVADAVRIHNCTQYGVNIYGNQAGDIILRDCFIYENGKVGQALSVGHGIASTRGNQNVHIIGGAIFDNLGHGFFGASAGLPASGIKIVGADIHGNGKRGISITEEQQWGVVPGNAGTTDVLIALNRIYDNGEDGIRIGTYDGGSAVGPLVDGKIVHNVIRDNGDWGILCQSTNVDGKRLENWLIEGNTIIDNGEDGLAIAADCRSIVHHNNDVRGNTNSQIVDNQTYWTAVTFQNSFTNAYGAPYAQCGYRKDDGIVRLKGTMNGSAPGPGFTLPVGFRPKGEAVIAPDGKVTINTDGTVEVAGTQPFRLDCVTFEADR